MYSYYRIVLPLLLMLPLSAQALTRYDFSFETDNTIKVSGTFYLSDTWSPNGTYQEAVSFTGYLDRGRNTDIQSGAFTSLVVRSDDPFLIRFNVAGIQYTANFGNGTEYPYELSYRPSGATTTLTEIYSPYSTPSRPNPAPIQAPELVPEIDGDKLPQVMLLAFGMYALFRTRRSPGVTGMQTA